MLVSRRIKFSFFLNIPSAYMRNHLADIWGIVSSIITRKFSYDVFPCPVTDLKLPGIMSQYLIHFCQLIV